MHAFGQGAERIPAASYVVGVDLGGTNIRLGLSDASGRVLQRWAASTVGLREPQQIVDHIARGADSMLLAERVPRDLWHGIGVGAPGVTDADRGIVLQTSYLLGWTDVPLVAMLEERLGVPAAVDNDVNIALLGEASAGAARGEADVVLVAIGTGIGAAIQLGGRLLHGRNWLAGEIGYMLVPGVSEAPVPEDQPGALESVAGGHGIQARWRELAQAHPELPAALQAPDIFNLAATGEPHARALLAHVANLLASALYNICLVVDVPLLVLGGSVGVHPTLHAAIEQRLALRHWRSRPRLAISALGTEAQLVGALALARQRAAQQLPGNAP